MFSTTYLADQVRDERVRRFDRPCTLDGVPARIVGFRQECATIYTSDPARSWREARFSWPAVERILAAGGEFRS